MRTSAALLALVLTLELAAGCATAPRPEPVPEGVPSKAVTGGAKTPVVNPSGADITRILEQSGLAFVTIEPERRWMVAFAGKRLKKVVLYVVHGDEFTVVLGKLVTVGKAASIEFYRDLARKNYDFDQLKLSLDGSGGVYASFEVPTRILDRQELLENIFGLAGAIDAVLPGLAEHADPQMPDDDDDDEGPPDLEPKRPVTPAGLGDIIEARRPAARPIVATTK